VIFIIFMFIYYAFTYDITAASLPFLFSLPMFLYVLVKYHRIVTGYDITTIDHLKLAFVVIYMGLGDPRMYILALLGLFVATVFQLIKAQLFTALKTLTTLLVVSIPYIIFMYKIYTFGSNAIYTSPRPFSYSEVDYWTKLYPLLTFFDFRALPWPASVSSSIGILGTSHIQTLPTLGRIPSILLSRNTLLDNFWFLSTMTPFALFAIPAVLKRFRVYLSLCGRTLHLFRCSRHILTYHTAFTLLSVVRSFTDSRWSLGNNLRYTKLPIRIICQLLPFL